MTPSKLLLFALAVLVGFTVETAAGFGATIVTVTLCAFFLPIDGILAVILPVNLVLSAILVFRYHRFISVRFLFEGILLWMGTGLVLALLLRSAGGQAWLRSVFSIFVVLLAAIELFRGASAEPSKPLGKPARVSMLLGAGIIHGFFACGGPMLVYVTAREVSDKAVFRSTLSAVWVILNIVLVGSQWLSGQASVDTLTQSLFLVPSLGLGLVLGERVHARVPETKFRRAVFWGLAIVGVLLFLRSLGA